MNSNKIRTNLARKYLPVQIEYAGSINSSARMPWVVDFDDLGADFAGVICLEKDLGSFEAGVYLQTSKGIWRFALQYKDVYKYMVGGDNDLRIIYRPPTQIEVPVGSTLLVNSVLKDSAVIVPSKNDLYALLTPRSADSSIAPNGLSDSSVATNPSVSEDIPLTSSGLPEEYLGKPSGFHLLTDPLGQPLLDAQGNKQVVPVYSIDAQGNFI